MTALVVVLSVPTFREQRHPEPCAKVCLRHPALCNYCMRAAFTAAMTSLGAHERCMQHVTITSRGQARSEFCGSQRQRPLDAP